MELKLVSAFYFRNLTGLGRSNENCGFGKAGASPTGYPPYGSGTCDQVLYCLSVFLIDKCMCLTHRYSRNILEALYLAFEVDLRARGLRKGK